MTADAEPGPVPGHNIVDFAQGGASGPPPVVPPPPRRRRRAGRIVFWVSFAVIVACFIGFGAGLRATARTYRNTSGSMANTLQSGDRLIVATRSDVRRGDIVIISDPQGPQNAPGSYVKRLIGLPGDHVACCDAASDVTVNGKELHEQEYLYPDDSPSRLSFSVTLRAGQVWVMGDHRTYSIDSRGWGPVPQANIVGWVFEVWRGSSFIRLSTPSTFVDDGLAPSGSRSTPAVLAYLGGAVLAALALLALSVLGVTRWAIRRSRAARMRREAAFLAQLP